MLNGKVAEMLKVAGSVPAVAAARSKATRVRAADIRAARAAGRTPPPAFPGDGCALFLSCLMEQVGIDVGFGHEGASDLSATLQRRSWEKVPISDPRPGDVLVTQDCNGNGLADHIALILKPMPSGYVLVIDNQKVFSHARSLTGADGHCPADYLLRAPA